MPKNQFQRPLPVRHDMKVPRHGKPQQPAHKAIKCNDAASATPLPPLASLLIKKSED